MDRLIAAHDWSRTPLGPVAQWSPSLRQMVGFMLMSRFPLLLWWGPHYISLYNDAYRPVLGAKHPWALGRTVCECWREVWSVLKPLIDTPFQGGPATWMDDLALEINRHGFLEEAHFTVAYSPVPDDTAPQGIGGVMATVHEITDKIVGERRIAALRDLRARAGAGRTAEEVCARAAAALRGYARDLPFVLFYLVDESGARARLAGTAGIEPGAVAAPPEVSLSPADGATAPWPLARAWRLAAPVPVEGLADRLSSVPPGPWADPPRAALILPIRSNASHRPAGLMVVGISSRLTLDEPYRGFLELVAAQVSTALSNATAYEAERRRAEALVELDRAKTVFFTNVSHEFRTPLTLLMAPLEEAVGRAPAGTRERQDLTIAHRNALRLLKLVNALLDFSRVEAGRARASRQATDLARFTAELASSFRSACEMAGLTLTVDCPPLAEPVYVDRDMWEKIVLNLLSNAFKFTFEGGIEVRMRAVGGHAELVVSDSGVGVPRDEMPRLFERFHRIAGQRSRSHEGSGIGLTLVRQLVILNGGTISASSRVGRGTRFIVRIPLGTAQLPQAPPDAGPAPVPTAVRADAYVQEALRWLPDGASRPLDAARAAGDGLPRPPAGAHVLLADDNADMRAYVRRLLETVCAVEAVADGHAALEAVRTRCPDLVLADVMMPGLDGLELLRAIREDPAIRDTPVILLSARAGDEARVEGLAAGADDYLVKPFSTRELVARVEANLKLARVRRRGETLLIGQKRILEMVATGAPLIDTLDELMGFIEAHEPAARCGILLLSEDGRHFRRGSGPSLPLDYHQALDGTPVTPPYLGACGEAVHRGTTVLVPDIANDDRYSAQWRELARSCGLAAVCTTPVLGVGGQVLATIALYYGTPRDPTPANPELLDVATHLAAIALEQSNAEAALRDKEERLQHIIDGAVEYAIIAMSREGVITTWNRGAERLLGYAEEEALGRPADIFFTPEDQARGEPAREMRLARLQGRAANERWHVRENGTRFWGSGVMLPLGGGKNTAYLKIFRDGTRERNAEERQRVLLNELNHRVKNTLAIVQAIAAQTFRSVGADARARRSFESRLRALAGAHDVLTRESWVGADLGRVVRSALAPFMPRDARRMRIDGPALYVSPKVALAFTMALHELATNAAKYGAMSTSEGRIEVLWSLDADRGLHFGWSERDGPAVAPPSRSGFGSRLIGRGLASIGAIARMDYCPGGLVCTVDMAFPALTQGDDS